MMRLTLLTLLTLAFTGCGDKDTNLDDTNSDDTEDIGVPCEEDKDSDLSCAEFDCDDNDATIRPGAYEIFYDNIDQNCNGMDDDRDADGDGVPLSVVETPDEILDCNDNNPDINPYREEINMNGIDDDCDTFIDNRFYGFDWSTKDNVDIEICDQKALIVGVVYYDEKTTEWNGSSDLVYKQPTWEVYENGCLEGFVDLSPPVNGTHTVFVWTQMGGDIDTNFVELGATEDAECIVWGPEAKLVVDYMDRVNRVTCTELVGQPVWSDELKDWAYKTTW